LAGGADRLGTAFTVEGAADAEIRSAGLACAATLRRLDVAEERATALTVAGADAASSSSAGIASAAVAEENATAVNVGSAIRGRVATGSAPQGAEVGAALSVGGARGAIG
jgi:hypothetical protein